MKQLRKRQNTTTTDKNPNWPEANQLAVAGMLNQGLPGTNSTSGQPVVRAALEPVISGSQGSALTTGPHYLV